MKKTVRSNTSTRASYNRVSGFYDLVAGSSEHKLIQKGIEKLRIKKGDKVLEIGCGTGYGLLLLSRLVGDKGKVSGIDISDGMIEKARARIDKAHLSRRVELIRGDARHLPYPVGSFDAVFMSFTLELFGAWDMSVVLDECRRAVKRYGGICVVAMSGKTGWGPVMKLYRAAHRHFPTWIDCRPIRLEETVNQAGFQILEIEQRSMWGLGVEIVFAVNPWPPVDDVVRWVTSYPG